MHGKVLFQNCRGFCQHHSALVLVADGFGLAIFGLILVEISFAFLQRSWDVCLFGKFGAEWGASPYQTLRVVVWGELAPKQPPEFRSLILLVIFVATVSSCVRDFSIANSCLPQDLQSSVISTGLTNVVLFSCYLKVIRKLFPQQCQVRFHLKTEAFPLVPIL